MGRRFRLVTHFDIISLSVKVFKRGHYKVDLPWRWWKIVSICREVWEDFCSNIRSSFKSLNWDWLPKACEALVTMGRRFRLLTHFYTIFLSSKFLRGVITMWNCNGNDEKSFIVAGHWKSLKHCCGSKDACTVKPRLKSVPPQLYFEFAAFWNGYARKRAANSI